MLILLPLFLVGYFVFKNNPIRLPGLNSPLHASCQITWELEIANCSYIQNLILEQINEWKSRDNCKNGGQKCLYSLKETNVNYIKATHTTPIRGYVDTLKFIFDRNVSPKNGCMIKVKIYTLFWSLF